MGRDNAHDLALYNKHTLCYRKMMPPASDSDVDAADMRFFGGACEEDEEDEFLKAVRNHTFKSGVTPLMLAARSNRLKQLKVLIAHKRSFADGVEGLYINKASESGCTALMMAAEEVRAA